MSQFRSAFQSIQARAWVVAVMMLAAAGAGRAASAAPLDFSKATIVVRGSSAPEAEQSAATILSEEVEKRTGLHWSISSRWPAEGTVVALTAQRSQELHGRRAPAGAAVTQADGYRIVTDASKPAQPTLWIVGADARGVLYGVGDLLRQLDWRPGTAQLTEPLNRSSAPTYAIRGHQLGYRATANSWDAWDIAQFDQYIRELALFGANCVEGIPFHDRTSPVMKVPRREMNRAQSQICKKYGLDYWVWSPADFDLKDEKRRAQSLADHEELFADCPALAAVFFPGGDPGDNPPELVMPFLEDMAKLLAKHHPKAKIWISLQGFDRGQVDTFYTWLNAQMPTWLGGVVAGPSSPPIPETRNRLPRQYQLRHYPDITHVVRAQFPVPWLDPAFALTLGREPVNPRPTYYRFVHNGLAPYTNGFLTYSDGIHDDVNKTIWSALGWDSSADLREVLVEYCRVFFGPDVAEQAADGIFDLERNWDGSLAINGGVDATLAVWQSLETRAPQLKGNWRWQLCLLRAYYDAYDRHRLIYESGLEDAANAVMAQAPALGADAAMDQVLAILKQTDTNAPHPEWHQRVVDLCDDLFHSIGFQTSVAKYNASGEERGAVLDYLDYPLNNRWWLEDEIAKARALPAEKDKCTALIRLAAWEHPGPGSFYDDIGNVAKSDHVIRGEGVNTAPDAEMFPSPNPIPDFMWYNEGKLRVRQSWISKMDWPLGLRYGGLDPDATYVVRTAGNRDCLLRINGQRIQPTVDGKELGDVKEFPVPKELYRDRALTLTFDAPYEPTINWRQGSRLSEVWLIKQ